MGLHVVPKPARDLHCGSWGRYHITRYSITSPAKSHKVNVLEAKVPPPHCLHLAIIAVAMGDYVVCSSGEICSNSLLDLTSNKKDHKGCDVLREFPGSH